MNGPQRRQAPKDSMPHVEVDDAAKAFQKLEGFTRRILAVPKTEIDAAVAKEKAEKKKTKRRRS
jgi:hypothetical protein